ncbi:MAG: hypothetical protein QXK88_07460 [Desulfurococcaceae archaeon]
MAIPEIYLDGVLDLLQKLKEVNKHEERIKIYVQIKENLVSASHSDIKRFEWKDELKLWVIKDYDKDLGIMRMKG